ncbi:MULTISPECIES: response regulator transcription factor [Actinomyces]|uniref:Response regulator transcription factor n=1 Tax=Actinomyces respiraculi TaxID=2744574 RepID=A0A7T0PVQ4_9ACTO|nr:MULTISPECIES: response regulator transcription factor [Actinomyces]QPL04673.1 response regulator transcription factor [Actinomyces respiraculi]
MSRILVVEDEPHIASFLLKGLKAAGFSAEATASGNEAIGLAVHDRADLIILDVGLPDVDGFTVLEQIRGQGVRVPVIMLTARSSVEARVKGLEGGADDYMPKPFSFEELLARVRLRLRDESPASDSDPVRLIHDDLALDLRRRTMEVSGATVELSAREFALAETFMRHPGQVLSRQQLLSGVWGYDFDPDSNVVEVYVSYLRAKIGKKRIQNVRGMGYRLV